MMNDQNNQLRRLVLLWLLALGLVWAACGDDGGEGPIAPPDSDVVDLSTFEGCWHVWSDTTVFGTPGSPCRTAIDSVADILKVAGAESLFAAIDTVTHLGFVAPYYGRGDFTGTNVSDRQGSVLAEYRDVAGACTLITRFDGSLTASGDSAFYAFYTVRIGFAGDTLCTGAGSCGAFVSFEGRRRPDGRCTP